MIPSLPVLYSTPLAKAAADDVSFEAGIGQQERELIRARIGDVLAA